MSTRYYFEIKENVTQEQINKTGAYDIVKYH
jgi:hypothetical protein